MSIDHPRYSRDALRFLRRTIGNNIHNARLKKRITLQKLSRTTGISEQLLDHYEMGKNAIDINDLFKISCILRLALKDIITQEKI